MSHLYLSVSVLFAVELLGGGSHCLVLLQFKIKDYFLHLATVLVSGSVEFPTTSIVSLLPSFQQLPSSFLFSCCHACWCAEALSPSHILSISLLLLLCQLGPSFPYESVCWGPIGPQSAPTDRAPPPFSSHFLSNYEPLLNQSCFCSTSPSSVRSLLHRDQPLGVSCRHHSPLPST